LQRLNPFHLTTLGRLELNLYRRRITDRLKKNPNAVSHVGNFQRVKNARMAPDDRSKNFKKRKGPDGNEINGADADEQAGVEGADQHDAHVFGDDADPYEPEPFGAYIDGAYVSAGWLDDPMNDPFFDQQAYPDGLAYMPEEWLQYDAQNNPPLPQGVYVNGPMNVPRPEEGPNNISPPLQLHQLHHPAPIPLCEFLQNQNHVDLAAVHDFIQMSQLGLADENPLDAAHSFNPPVPPLQPLGRNDDLDINRLIRCAGTAGFKVNKGDFVVFPNGQSLIVGKVRKGGSQKVKVEVFKGAWPGPYQTAASEDEISFEAEIRPSVVFIAMSKGLLDTTGVVHPVAQVVTQNMVARLAGYVRMKVADFRVRF
jgi:hypothetical protein